MRRCGSPGLSEALRRCREEDSRCLLAGCCGLGGPRSFDLHAVVTRPMPNVEVSGGWEPVIRTTMPRPSPLPHPSGGGVQPKEASRDDAAVLHLDPDLLHLAQGSKERVDA